MLASGMLGYCLELNVLSEGLNGLQLSPDTLCPGKGTQPWGTGADVNLQVSSCSALVLEQESEPGS